MKIGEMNTIEIDDVYVHPDSIASEETLLVVLSSLGTAFLTTINLDLSNLTIATTIRVYYAIDGTSYRLRYGNGPVGGTIAWATADGPWLAIMINGIVDHDIKITIQSSGGGEAAPRNVPFSYNGAR